MPPTNAEPKRCPFLYAVVLGAPLVFAIVFAIALAVILPGSLSAKNSQAEPTIPSRSLNQSLSVLEKQLSLQAPETATLSDRLTNLEKSVFGNQQNGSLVERLDNLKQAVSARQQKAPTKASEPREHFADPEIARIIKMMPLTNESKLTFVRIEPPGTNLNQVGDYFDTVEKASQHRLLRFQRMPVPIYITPYQDEGYMRACHGAFAMWEERSNGIVKFAPVDDPAKARIRVTWSHLGMGQHPGQSQGDCVLGAHTITQWGVAPGSELTSLVIGGMPVTLPHRPKYVVQPQVIEVNLDLINSKPEEVRLRLLRNVVAHELGHAIGLMGHSPQRSDLMNALTDECSRLSQRDINTLKKLYNSPLDITL